MPESEQIRDLLIVLLANGFIVENVEPSPSAIVVSCTTWDRFGGQLRYVLLCSEVSFPAPAIENAAQRAERERAQLVVVGPNIGVPGEIPILSSDQFLARFGGPMASLLPLEATYRARLLVLGSNDLPEGLSGRPADLFEEYVAAGVQFLIGRRVIPYGRRRSGESVPDGIALAGTTYALFDAKAAARGLELDAEVIRQFATYVNDFARRYKLLGTPHAFVCVSGSFASSDEARRERSAELYSKCRTPLVTIAAAELAAAVEFLRDNIGVRQFLDWPRLLSAPILTATDIVNAARAAQRDGLSA